MNYSTKKAIQDGIDMKIKRAKCMCKNDDHSDFKIKHSDWVKDAQTQNYVLLIKKIKEESAKNQADRKARVEKLGHY